MEEYFTGLFGEVTFEESEKENKATHQREENFEKNLKEILTSCQAEIEEQKARHLSEIRKIEETYRLKREEILQSTEDETEKQKELSDIEVEEKTAKIKQGNINKQEIINIQAKRLEDAFIENNFLSNASTKQLMLLFTTFRDIGAFSHMETLYNKCNNPTFTQSLMVQEFLMLSFNKTSRPDKTIQLAEKLISDGKISGDVFGALGKAYLIKSDQTSSPEEKRFYLEKSKQAYHDGFTTFMEFYPGINAAYRAFDTGEIEQAKRIAEIVYLICKKEGVEETKDYWCAATQFEAACILEKSEQEIRQNFQELMSYAVADWQIKTTLDSLTRISDKMKILVEKLTNEYENKNTSLGNSSDRYQNYEKNLAVILKNSFSYRGLASNFEGANIVGGNMKFGGQLQDHVISRKDIEIFDQILSKPIKEIFPNGHVFKSNINPDKSLNQIEDFAQFLSVIDEFIRFHFGTENFAKTGLNLENNAEINNSVYDQTIKAFISLAGIDIESKQNLDSRTNISTILALGSGDCRHHAQVKQLLFDRWQEKKLDSILFAAYNSKSKEEFDMLIKKYHEVLNIELRTIDVNVILPIKINGKYDAVKANGKFVESSQESLLEEHTMSILIRRKQTEDGKQALESARLVDSFYQKNYPWGGFEINIDAIEETPDGNFTFNAGELEPERVNTGRSLPITVESTIFAGKRENQSQGDTCEQIYAYGLPIKCKDATELVLNALQERAEREGILNLIRTNAKHARRISPFTTAVVATTTKGHTHEVVKGEEKASGEEFHG